MKVLVKENIGESGVDLLRTAGFEVDLGYDWSDDDLAARIGDYDAILIRSATKLDADLLAKAERLRIVARAGVGVDNVDVDAATRQGVVVANAPQSNVVTAAEHTMALLLALARNVPQAHGSLVAGRWDRSKFTGVEVHDKVLGIIGFGRIGQLVAHRARGFGMRVLAFDAYMAEERFAELGVERAASAEAVYAVADFITVHLPKNAETQDFLDAKAFAAMKDGVRILNVARGPLVVDEALKDALDSGKVAGAALDVFREEPITEHPLFGYPNVVVTPHLGASTTEATDRAGFQAAEQVVAVAHRCARHHRRQRPGDLGRRRAGGRAVPRALPVPRTDRGRARAGHVAGGARGRVPRPRRRTRSPAADDSRRQGSAAGPHRGRRQRRQRPHAGGRARHRRLDHQPSGGPRLHRSRPRHHPRRHGTPPASSARCSGSSIARTCSRPGARASTCSSSRISRCSATATSPGCSAASARRSATRASTSSPPPSAIAATPRAARPS